MSIFRPFYKAVSLLLVLSFLFTNNVYALRPALRYSDTLDESSASLYSIDIEIEEKRRLLSRAESLLSMLQEPSQVNNPGGMIGTETEIEGQKDIIRKTEKDLRNLIRRRNRKANWNTRLSRLGHGKEISDNKQKALKRFLSSLIRQKAAIESRLSDLKKQQLVLNRVASPYHRRDIPDKKREVNANISKINNKMKEIKVRIENIEKQIAKAGKLEEEGRVLPLGVRSLFSPISVLENLRHLIRQRYTKTGI